MSLVSTVLWWFKESQLSRVQYYKTSSDSCSLFIPPSLRASLQSVRDSISNQVSAVFQLYGQNKDSLDLSTVTERSTTTPSLCDMLEWLQDAERHYRQQYPFSDSFGWGLCSVQGLFLFLNSRVHISEEEDSAADAESRWSLPSRVCSQKMEVLGLSQCRGSHHRLMLLFVNNHTGHSKKKKNGCVDWWFNSLKVVVGATILKMKGFAIVCMIEMWCLRVLCEISVLFQIHFAKSPSSLSPSEETEEWHRHRDEWTHIYTVHLGWMLFLQQQKMTSLPPGETFHFCLMTVKNRCIELLSAGPGGPKQMYFSTHENKDSLWGTLWTNRFYFRLFM